MDKAKTSSILDFALCQLQFRFRGSFKYTGPLKNTVDVGLEVVHMMLKMKALTPSEKSVYWAARFEDFDLVQQVVQLRAKAGKLTPEELYCGLGPTASYRNRATFEYLLSMGVSVNKNTGGICYIADYETPLFAASLTGSLKMVEKLLDMGANIDQRGVSHDTALQAAILVGRLDVVALLLRRGADVDARAIPGTQFLSGQPALMKAIALGHTEIARMLLEFGANVNTEIKSSPCGLTYGNINALGYAAHYGRLDTVQLLLNAGADSYDHAIGIALEEGNLIVADLIQDWKECKEREASANDPWGSSEL
ncbi:hypothetical protein HYALB_00005249 [Hymenoscyphus albidus]|uniref:Ankyrin n=1 Tax=Hymenoscyphus albidus TaxID=595503 RepID=A0A9N9LSU8_9HELO|nr:hypothetical protein HYALB_00005249 [Hymenoscyphus albidus]